MAEEKQNIIHEMQNKKSKLEAQLEKLEKFIFDKETKYLESTITTGNILKGWEHFFTSKTKLPARTLQSGKRLRISNTERLFSQTSYNNSYLNEDTQANNSSVEKSQTWNNNNNNNLISKNFNAHRRKKKISQSLSFKKKKNHLSMLKESSLSNQQNMHMNNIPNDTASMNDDNYN